MTPSKNQTNKQLLGWLKESYIASETLIPQLRRARLPGAKIRALTKKEIQEYKMKPEAALFSIHNQDLTFDDEPSVRAFEEEQVLIIRGKNNACIPSKITLHCVEPTVPVSDNPVLDNKPREKHDE